MRKSNILKVEVDGKELVGTVALNSSSTNFRNYLEVYDFGFPVTFKNFNLELYEKETNENISELNKAQFIEHLEKKSEELYSLTESKDLAAACFASRHHYLNGIIENIKKVNDDKVYFHNIVPKYPETGVYVLSARDQKYDENNSGHRNDGDPSKINLEGISFNPRVTPRIASQIVSRWYGNKFGSVEGVEINLGINFNSFFCHEVPEFALDFVKNPAVFTCPVERVEYSNVDHWEKD